MKSGFLEALFCVGLTGGIGCGKSTVADMFAKLGAGIIDTDVIAHRLTQRDGDAIGPILDTFGKDYIAKDGTLDREKMRALIFSDADAKKRLELILHPMIFDTVMDQLQQLHNKPYIVIVVPLLTDSPAYRKLVQRVLVVDCDEKSQIDRVIARSQMTSSEVKAIIAQQAPRSEYLQLADDVVYNDAGLDNLAKQVAVMHHRYSNMQGKH